MRALGIIRSYPWVVATLLALVVTLVLELTGSQDTARWLPSAYGLMVVAWVSVGMQGPDARPLGHRHPGRDRHPVHDPSRRAHRRTDRVPDAHRRRGARGLRREQGQEEPVLPARARSTGRPPPPARRLDRRRPPRGGGDRRPRS